MLDLFTHIQNSPTHWYIWMNILGLFNFGAIFFASRDVRARWVVAAMIGNMIFMTLLYKHFGYTRILGLSHIVFWTPLVIYLWRKRESFPERIWATRWLYGVIFVNTLSLLIDYTDVIRFIAGDKAPL